MGYSLVALQDVLVDRYDVNVSGRTISGHVFVGVFVQQVNVNFGVPFTIRVGVLPLRKQGLKSKIVRSN